MQILRFNIFCFLKNHLAFAVLCFLILLAWQPQQNTYGAVNIDTAEQYLHEQNYNEAINAYTTLIQSIDTIANLYYGRGIANYNIDAMDTAIADFTRAIALDKNNSNAFLGLANSYILNQQYDNAVKVLNKRLGLDTSAADLLYSRAVAYFLNNNYKAAVSDFDKTIGIIKSSNSETLTLHHAIYGKAIANYKLQNYAKSKIDLEECIAQNKLEANYIAECKKLLFIIGNI